jgi:hypothetical protein
MLREGVGEIAEAELSTAQDELVAEGTRSCPRTVLEVRLMPTSYPTNGTPGNLPMVATATPWRSDL